MRSTAVAAGTVTQGVRIWRPLRAPVLTTAVLAGAVTVLALRDPHVPGSYGVCPLYALTGWYCAGCGALRATHDLAHLDVSAAWGMNPLLVLAAPVLVILLGWWTWRRLRAARALRAGEDVDLPHAPGAAWAYATGAVIVVYSVLRNVPAFAPWLVPA